MKNLISILLIFFISFSYSQWTNDSTANFIICDTTGESAIPKIVNTSSGGNYISWFDNRGGSYAVYLQRQNEFGVKQWANNGLLISSNPQNSSLVDYDLICDQQDNAIVAFTDIRTSSLNVFAYKISPTGNFVWGNNGVSLSSTTEYQANPEIAVTNDGNIVVAWIIAVNPYKVALQKLSASGTKLWGTTPIIYQSTSGEGYNYPQLVTSDSGSVILVHTVTTGSFPAQVVKIAAQKFSANGTPQWGTGGTWIQNIGKAQNFSPPFVSSDKNNGALISWYDDRDNNNLQNSFVQRINSLGTVLYPANGTELSLISNEHKFYPVSVILNSFNEVYAFWLEKNSLQSSNSIMGQKISSNGGRLWTDNGAVFLPTTSNSITSLLAAPIDSSIYLFYNEGNVSGVQNKIMSLSVSRNGNNLWQYPVTLSKPTQEKLKLVCAVDIFKVGKSVWVDRRNDAGGIYAQNVNPNGSLGNVYVPVELTNLYASFYNDAVNLNWTTATEVNNAGFEIQRKNSASTEFNKVGFIEGKGTTTSISKYSFTDICKSNGKFIYRLKQIDFDRTINYSNEIEVDINVPIVCKLSQNYPNPFSAKGGSASGGNPSTVINYQIKEKGFVTLKVYDMLGNEVAKLVNEMKESGSYSSIFLANNLASGVYVYRISITDGSRNIFSDTKRMLLIK